MRRRTFDTLMTTGGAMITIVLVVAGALLLVGYNFANDNVSQQLAQQKIFFPDKGPATASPEIGPFINKYAGKQLVTGAQAEAYANHFIAVHISEIGKGTPYAGMTYAELGTYQRAHPEDATVGPARDTVFKGETLRGLLLNAYAFWKVGQIALIGAIAAFAGAGVMALLTVLGFWHLRRVSLTEEVFVPRGVQHAGV